MIHFIPRLLLYAAIGVLAGMPSQTIARTPQTVIVGVRIIDTQTGTVSAPTDIIIEGGVIADVRPLRRRSRNQTRIDGHNKFVLAGLWDLHVHLLSSPNPNLPSLDPATWYAPIAMSYGVMGMRDLGSRMEAIVELRTTFEDVRADGRPAPRLKLAGSSFMGPVSWGRFDHVYVATSPDDAARQVRTHVAGGVDIIKVHDFLSEDIYRAILAEAARQGRPVTGHMRAYAGPLDAIAAGQRNFEHIQPELFAYCAGDGQARAEALYAGWYQGGPGYFERAMAALYDPHGCTQLYQAMGAAGAAVTPTITSRLAPSPRALVAAESLLPPAHRKQCKQFVEAMAAVPSADSAAFRAVVDKALVALVESGVNVLSGTDGVPENCAVPGLTLLDELEALVQAGLPRAYVLDAATRRGAAMAGVQDGGTVAPGMTADLVLLDGNPLDDLGVLEQPAGLVIAGRYVDGVGIEAMREQALKSVCCRGD